MENRPTRTRRQAPTEFQGNLLVNQIKLWVDTVPYADFEKAIFQRIKGQPELSVILANVYNYFYCLANNIMPNNNVLIAAPSGCGKTETYRALRDYFKEKISYLPITQVDMTSITEEGFRGKDTNHLIQTIMDNSYSTGQGIIFMDELDKKLLPSFTSNGCNVNAAVQSQLLTTIEGRTIEDGLKTINTGMTLFIGLGSFDEVRKRKAAVKQDVSVGFLKEEKKETHHYSPITRQDIIDLGASYEFVGRFTALVNYKPLSDRFIDNIIDLDLKKVSDRLGYRVCITRPMRSYLHELTNGKYGCRILESTMLEAAMPMYSTLLRVNKSRTDTLIMLDRNKAYIMERKRSKEA